MSGWWRSYPGIKQESGWVTVWVEFKKKVRVKDNLCAT